MAPTLPWLGRQVLGPAIQGILRFTKLVVMLFLSKSKAQTKKAFQNESEMPFLVISGI